MGTRSIAAALVSALALLVVLSPQAAYAQDASAADAQQMSELWRDFLHYIRLGRADLARSYGKAIIESSAAPREVYLLSTGSTDLLATLRRGERLDGMSEIIDGVRQLIEKGYHSERSDPTQIANSIEMLGGTVRSYEIARDRLKQSGEYALPQLIHKLSDPDSPALLRERINNVLPELGKEAVRGLSMALQSDRPELIETIANTLGKIPYRHAAPALKELTLRQDLPDRTRLVAQAALANVAGPEAVQKPLAELLYSTALDYYYNAESIRPDGSGEMVNVWYWQQGLGLTYTPVPREIFNDVYAMRLSQQALRADGGFYPAVSLWLSANLHKTANLPAGATDPTATEGELTAADYALASSARYLQDVLARALKDHNSAVAMGAIEALAKTAGAKNLVEPVAGGVQPLVQALTYSDRRVRFLAALTLANATPTERFTGYQLVMPILAEALRQTGVQRALLAVEDQNQRNALTAALRSAGFEIIEASEATQAVSAVREVAGVDLVVVGEKPSATGLVNLMRQDPAMVTLPVVVADNSTANQSLAEVDGRVVVIAAGAEAGAIADAIEKALSLGMHRPMSPEEAREGAIQTTAALRLLGATGTGVFDITRTRQALVGAMGNEDEQVRVSAAVALAEMADSAAQQALADQALKQDLPQSVRIATFNALSTSLRRFGTQLNESQAQAIMSIVLGNAAAELRNAASQSLGAMNLPSEQVKDIILNAPRR